MTEHAPYRPPNWGKPGPLGYGAAADAAHFVAAPLLASAAIALTGVVAADADKFRLPSVVLLVLALAAIALVASIQYGFHARALLYSAADVAAWWGEDTMGREAMLQARQREHFEQWRRQIGRAVTAYNIGLTFLGAALALSIAPPPGTGQAGATLRWITCGIVSAATLYEFTWTLAKRGRRPRTRRGGAPT